jgi:hypothetical protein
MRHRAQAARLPVNPKSVYAPCLPPSQQVSTMV